jgi:hypothetical protein
MLRHRLVCTYIYSLGHGSVCEVQKPREIPIDIIQNIVFEVCFGIGILK